VWIKQISTLRGFCNFDSLTNLRKQSFLQKSVIAGFLKETIKPKGFADYHKDGGIHNDKTVRFYKDLFPDYSCYGGSLIRQLPIL